MIKYLRERLFVECSDFCPRALRFSRSYNSVLNIYIFFGFYNILRTCSQGLKVQENIKKIFLRFRQILKDFLLEFCSRIETHQHVKDIKNKIRRVCAKIVPLMLNESFYIYLYIYIYKTKNRKVFKNIRGSFWIFIEMREQV